jgi:hypothetical protein
MNVWLVGSNGEVRATIIIKWSKDQNANAVRGSIELFTPDSQGMPTCRQVEVCPTLYPLSVPLLCKSRVIRYCLEPDDLPNPDQSCEPER